MEKLDKKQKIVNRLIIAMFIFWIPWIISLILVSLDLYEASSNPIIGIIGIGSFIIALSLGFTAAIVKYRKTK